MIKKILTYGAGLLFLLVTASYIHAAGVTLAWDPPEEGSGGPVEGYMLYWGTISGIYPNSKDVGNVNQETISGLDEDSPYFFVVKAYNGGGTNIGPPSNEISWSYSDTTPPLPPEGVEAQ